MSSSDNSSSAQGINIGYYFRVYAPIIGVYLVVGLLRLLLIYFGSRGLRSDSPMATEIYHERYFLIL